MQEIIIHTQKEFDQLPAEFKEYTRIFIQDTKERIHVTKAWENSQVVARENSQVVAWGNSQVEAWGNSQVEARENSQVVAWGNSQVVARENSQVVARENVGVHLTSDWATVALFAFSVCWKLAKGKITKKSKTATIIKPEYKGGTDGWLERNGVEAKREKVVLFKRVSKEFLTQEGTANETTWKVGTTVTHPSWEPTKAECGPGKFHACPTAYLCDEFRNTKDDRYVAIEVKKKDLFAWDESPSYPHKIAFREGKVVYECDKFGRKM